MKQTMFFGDDQPQEMDFQAIADQIVAEGEPQEPYIGAGGNVQPSGFMPNTGKKWGQRPGRQKPDWKFDPITGKPVGGTTPEWYGPIPPGWRGDDEERNLPGGPYGGLRKPGVDPNAPAPAFDFWGNVGTLLGEDVTPDDISMLKELFEQDPSWKAPTSNKAQKLFKTAAALQKMGYTDEQTMGQILGSLFDMGYRQPAFSLSLFSRMLQPYGLGVGGGSSAKKSSGTDISALLGL